MTRPAKLTRRQLEVIRLLTAEPGRRLEPRADGFYRILGADGRSVNPFEIDVGVIDSNVADKVGVQAVAGLDGKGLIVGPSTTGAYYPTLSAVEAYGPGLRLRVGEVCDDCGGKVSSYRNGCPGCGAPQCCQACCDEANGTIRTAARHREESRWPC